MYGRSSHSNRKKTGDYSEVRTIKDRTGEGDKVVFEVNDEETVIFPEISDPHAKLQELREEYQFSREELDAMRVDADRIWDRLSS